MLHIYMQAYMSSVKASRADDVATKKEREARRRKMLVEQQAAASEAERKAQVSGQSICPCSFPSITSEMPVSQYTPPHPPTHFKYPVVHLP